MDIISDTDVDNDDDSTKSDSPKKEENGDTKASTPEKVNSSDLKTVKMAMPQVSIFFIVTHWNNKIMCKVKRLERTVFLLFLLIYFHSTIMRQ